MSRAPITQWSYSRYETWNQCPRKAYFQYVAKYPTGPKGPALARGIAAHEICAEIYNGKWPPIPDNEPVLPSLGWRRLLSHHKTFYGSDLEVELQVSYDAEWKQTGWWDKQTVYRCIFDGLGYTPARSRTLKIFEHKTGKVRDSHVEQAEWYAGVGSLLVPDADVIEVDIHYLDSPENSPKAVRRMTVSSLAAQDLLRKWEGRAIEMMTDVEYPTRAGYHCRWCPYRNSVGGPCHLG